MTASEEWIFGIYDVKPEESLDNEKFCVSFAKFVKLNTEYEMPEFDIIDDHIASLLNIDESFMFEEAENMFVPIDANITKPELIKQIYEKTGIKHSRVLSEALNAPYLEE
jgi:hypothetical protein